MATDPGQEGFDCPLDFDMTNQPQQSNDESFNDAPDEGGEYREVTTTHSVPTKQGGEEDMQVDSDRPASAGTTGTNNSMPMNEEDEQILAATRVTRKDKHRSAPQQLIERPSLLSRPQVPTESHAPPSFFFATATKKPMDFQGTHRRAHAATPGSGQAHPPGDVGSVPEQQPTDVIPETMSVPTEQAHMEQADMAPSHVEPTGERPRHGKTKKRKVRRSSRAPAPDGPADSKSHMTAARESTETQAVIQPHHSLDVHAYHQQAAETMTQGTTCYAEIDDRPATPVNDPTPAQDNEEVQQWSSHDQLRPEYDNAAQRQSEDCQEMQVQRHETPNAQHAQHARDSAPDQSHQSQEHYSAIVPASNEAPDIGHHFSSIKPAKAKRHSRAPRRASSGPHVQTGAADNDINDYMQILVYKIREQGQLAVNQLTAERDSVQQELQQVIEAKQNLESQLNSVLNDNGILMTTCEEQKIKMKTYETKVKKFKTFVDGLGRDVDSLKREANKMRDRNAELVAEGEECKTEREGLLERMNDATERSSQLKKEALAAYADVQKQLSDLQPHAIYLQQQLSDKVGLLAEERDRRSNLEKRLLSDSKQSEVFLKAIQANHEALLDKVYILHAAVESTDAGSKASDLLQETLEAGQEMSAHTTSNADNAIATKSLVEALSERFTELRAGFSTQPLQNQLNDVLSGLRSITDHQQDCTRLETAHRDSLKGLQDELRDSRARVDNAEGELRGLRGHESNLIQENQKLQSKVIALQSRPASSGEEQAVTSKAKVELQAISNALETANSNLNSKSADLESLRRTNKQLNDSIHDLREKICELEQTAVELAPEKQAAEAHIRREVERVRAESLKHSQDYRAQLEMESKNQIRKLTSDRDRYEKQIAPLKVELANSKKTVENLQKKAGDTAALTDRLTQTSKVADSRAREIETLQASINSLQQSANVDESLKKKLSKLEADIDAAKASLDQASEEKTALLKKREEYVQDSNRAREAYEQVKAELSTYRINTEPQLERLEKELKDAQGARRRAEAGHEHLQKTGEAAIDEEKARSRREKEGLQRELAQAKSEKFEVETQAEEFRADIEKQWQTQEAEHSQLLDDLRDRIRKAEAARDEAIATSERSVEGRETLLGQVNVLKQQLAATEEKLKTHEQSSHKVQEESACFKVPNLSEGITPAGSLRTMAPTKPRKKVDRSQGSTLDSTALPISDELRPDSRREGGIQAGHRSIFDRSQVEETQFTQPVVDAVAVQSANFAMFSDVDETQQPAHGIASQQPTERVEETQFDSLPSFAAFNRGLPGSQRPSFDNRTSSSLPLAHDKQPDALFGAAEVVNQDWQRDSGSQYAAEAAPSVDGFQIYDDSQSAEENAQDSRNKTIQDSQEEIALSREEREKYTFRKPVAQSNSASKRVRESSQASAGAVRRTGSLQDRQPLRERRLETPEARSGTGRSSQIGTAHSSSPAYAQPTSSRPTRTYSNNTPGGPGMRRSSRTQSFSTQDPRLAGRSQPQAPKRKALEPIVEGYEHERKKRLVSTVPAASAPANRLSQLSSSQQSIRDLHSLSSISASRGQSSQTRSRHFGGASARTLASRKPAKGNDFNARFSKELRR